MALGPATRRRACPVGRGQPGRRHVAMVVTRTTLRHHVRLVPDPDASPRSFPGHFLAVAGPPRPCGGTPPARSRRRTASPWTPGDGRRTSAVTPTASPWRAAPSGVLLQFAQHTGTSPASRAATRCTAQKKRLMRIPINRARRRRPARRRSWLPGIPLVGERRYPSAYVWIVLYRRSGAGCHGSPGEQTQRWPPRRSRSTTCARLVRRAARSINTTAAGATRSTCAGCGWCAR